MTPVSPSQTTATEPRELDLFAFVLMLLRNLWLIFGCGLLALVFMGIKMLRAKPRFASTAVMIVPQGNSTTTSLAAQLSVNTYDLLGGGLELYGDILHSRKVTDQLISDFDLKKVYGTSDLASAEDILASLTTVQTAREGLIRVTVEDTDPQRAADLANDYLAQLDRLNTQLVRKNVFDQLNYLDTELYKEKDALTKAEQALKQAQVNSSGVPPQEQANAGVSAVESARANLRADEVRLGSLLTGETEQNPDVIRIRAEIASLTSQVNELQHGQPSTSNGTPIASLPEQEMQFVALQREVAFHEELFSLLEKQDEAEKQQAAKSPSIVQMLDYAVPSRHKAWPPRTYYSLLAGVAGLVFGVFLVGFKAVALAYMRNPENASKLRQLKTFWRK